MDAPEVKGDPTELSSVEYMLKPERSELTSHLPYSELNTEREHAELGIGSPYTQAPSYTGHFGAMDPAPAEMDATPGRY